MLFVHKDQLTGVVSDYLSDLNVEIKDYANIDNTLKSVSSNYTTIFASETVSRAVASDSGFVGIILDMHEYLISPIEPHQDYDITNHLG